MESRFHSKPKVSKSAIRHCIVGSPVARLRKRGSDVPLGDALSVARASASIDVYGPIADFECIDKI
jgi:hypothetical protein